MTAPQSNGRAALEQCAWADSRGFDHVQLSEHHGAEDGYCPSPMVLAAAIAARTGRMRLLFAGMILPVHDPVRVAEDIAVLDLVSGGRVDAGFVPGYRDAEYTMFGTTAADRYRRFDEGLTVLRRAWAGEPFVHEGREITVTPRPVQRPHPPLYLGGRTIAMARRAAALADGMLPASSDPRLREAFVAERSRLGLSPGRWYVPAPAHSVIVTDDPERTWAKLGPHALHDARVYAGWAAAAGLPHPAAEALQDARALAATGQYQVVTPDECVRLAASLTEEQRIVLHPLLGGVDPEVGWSSLELFAGSVLPRLTGALTGD